MFEAGLISKDNSLSWLIHHESKWTLLSTIKWHKKYSQKNLWLKRSSSWRSDAMQILDPCNYLSNMKASFLKLNMYNLELQKLQKRKNKTWSATMCLSCHFLQLGQHRCSSRFPCLVRTIFRITTERIFKIQSLYSYDWSEFSCKGIWWKGYSFMKLMIRKLFSVFMIIKIHSKKFF